jgi:hypothetical protein
LAVTTYEGAVKILKLPPVLDPLQLDRTHSSIENHNNPSYVESEVHVKINSDISDVKSEDLILAEHLIGTIPAKIPKKFTDPFKYASNMDEEGNQLDVKK